jgi:hypothetical protein
MQGPLPPNRVPGQPRPIKAREGRRASLISLPREFGLAGERRGKASEKNLLPRSLVDPAVAFRKLRPKVVAAPPIETFLLVEVPRHLEGMWGDLDSETEKLALLPPRRKVFPVISHKNVPVF